ncbi:MAG: alkaline phosphatase family protein [Chloroflexi bacterium]|nr:MAG: alkaline phosphatase family protein [Chloroflexota bacterium]
MRTYLPLAIVPLALILWGLFGAPALLNTGFRVLSDYQTPYTEQPQPGADGEALTSQVVLVVAGGLRLDQSTQMSNLNALRARGADRLMRAGLPSFSLPAWSVIGTGAWPEHTGQSTDISARPLALDSIFLAARRKGSSTALTGPPGWSVLFKDHVEMLISEPSPPAAPSCPAITRRRHRPTSRLPSPSCWAPACQQPTRVMYCSTCLTACRHGRRNAP